MDAHSKLKQKLAIKLAKLETARSSTVVKDKEKNMIRGKAYGEKYDLIETIKSVQRDFFEEGVVLDEITRKYPEFVRDYAIIANLATSRPFTPDDYNNIKLMMDKRSEYWDGKCTAEDAHAEVSMVGAARYQPKLLNHKFRHTAIERMQQTKTTGPGPDIGRQVPDQVDDASAPSR